MKERLKLLLTVFFLLVGCVGVAAKARASSNITGNKEAGRIAIKSTESELLTAYEFDVYELRAERDGLSICGNAFIPAVSTAKIPMVIICHGFNNGYGSQVEYAVNLAKIGIASYIFDFCGGSAGSRSDGSMLDMSLRTEVADLQAVIDFIQTLDFVDTENIFLMGQSMGGAAAALAAAQRQNEINGLILLYPAFVIPDHAGQYASVDDIPDQIPYLGAVIGKRFHEDVWGMDIYDEIQGYRNNVLIMHGDKDDLVPLSYSQRAVAIYDAATLVVIKGAEHGFFDQNSKKAMAEIIDYLWQQIV